ncbi:hypothetical protein PR048_027979 [Dryococelus australis]|uniref:Uncharacterized protein n=1 Tax=Dryococelus australis TaxID=614101 RepID=A0ABQ9GHY7_9NEOP|nr:hypothetical protein PR048_027979 [Dryococelus australis]
MWDDLRKDPKRFYGYLHMTRDTFDYILSEVRLFCSCCTCCSERLECCTLNKGTPLHVSISAEDDDSCKLYCDESLELSPEADENCTQQCDDAK